MRSARASSPRRKTCVPSSWARSWSMSERGGAPTRLYLLRHGLVHNPDELAYGHLPRFHPTPGGPRQADGAGRWLAEKGIAAIFTSPLLRARQTVRIIRRYLDGAPVHVLRALRESELARVWQGERWQEIAIRYPELYETFLEAPSRI